MPREQKSIRSGFEFHLGVGLFSLKKYSSGRCLMFVFTLLINL